jgi:acetyltransferase-like isoleucine patch superfamily enzyme
MKNSVRKIVLSSKFLTRIAQYFLRLRLQKRHNIIFGSNVVIGLSTVCEGRNYFGDNASIMASEIGYASYLGDGTSIIKSKIGRFTCIGPKVNCIFGKHPTNTFVSSHPAFFSLRKQTGITYVKSQLFDEFEKPVDPEGKYSIVIGNDVWIGYGVSIMDGVTIGDGAIIASNSLVNKNVDPYTIVGGSPAKYIKSRFDEEHIKFLLRFKWWDKELSWIEQNAHHFTDIEKFYKNFNDE